MAVSTIDLLPPPLSLPLFGEPCILSTVSFSLKFDPDIILIRCGLLALSRLEYLFLISQVAILMLIFSNVRHFSLTKRGHGISSGIEERACGNSRRQLKKK